MSDIFGKICGTNNYVEGKVAKTLQWVWGNSTNWSAVTTASTAVQSVCLHVRLYVRLCMFVARLAKFDMDKTKIQGFRENLKSTGQSKFTIDEKDETSVSYYPVLHFIHLPGPSAWNSLAQEITNTATVKTQLKTLFVSDSLPRLRTDNLFLFLFISFSLLSAGHFVLFQTNWSYVKLLRVNGCCVCRERNQTGVETNSNTKMKMRKRLMRLVNKTSQKKMMKTKNKWQPASATWHTQASSSPAWHLQASQ